MPNENLKQIIEHLKSYKEITTKSDLVAFIKVVTDFVKKIDSRNVNDVKVMKDFVENLAVKLEKEMKDKGQGSREEMMTMCDKMCKKMDKEVEKMMVEHKKRMEAVKDGKDADPVNEEKILSTLTERLPNAEKLALEVVKNGEATRDSLELLQGEERLDKKAIKGLDEEFEKVNNRFGGVSKAIGGINIGALKRHLLNIDVSSQCNGDTRTFTIPSNFGIFGVFSTQDPKIFRPTIDYTAGNRTVILDSGIPPIQSGQTLIIQIFK